MPIFGDNAPAYMEAGFRVFPTGGPDGKRPLIRGWNKVGERACLALREQFPDANVGMLDDGIVTRIDIDDQLLIDMAIERFGDTPIKVETPSGGLHLWFRGSGERRRLGIDGLKIDVLGLGGYGNAPPSRNPQRGSYRFVEGSLDDVHRLRRIRRGSLSPQADEEGPSAEPRYRNITLFRKCLRDLKDGHDPEIVPCRAQVWNEGLDEPLPEPEVCKTAKSAIRYHMQGNNWIGGEGTFQLPKAEFETFEGDSDCLYLYALLQFNHGSRAEPFAIASRNMAQARIIPGWGHKRYEEATKRLIGVEKLVRVRNGGGRGNPNLYVFADKLPLEGA